MKDAPDKLKPFIFHGLDLESVGNHRHKTDCPFCGASSKFFANDETGQWDCKSCQEKGNIPVFLDKLHKTSVEATKDTDLEPLAKNRNIPVPALREWAGIAKSIITGDPIIPSYNAAGKLANLAKVIKDGEKWLVLSTPGCKQWPFGPPLGNKTKRDVWIVEGPWDGAALYAALSQVSEKKGGGFVRTIDSNSSLHKSNGVMALPGAGNFQAEWSEFIGGKVVHICLDNDHPRVVCRKCKEKRYKTEKTCKCGAKDTTGQTLQAGWQGTNRAVKIIADASKQPKSLKVLKWGDEGFDKDRKHGYDVRDAIKELGPIKALELLYGLLENVDVEETAKKEDDDSIETFVEPLDRSDFKTLCKDFEGTLHFTQPLRDTLAVMLAVCISTDLKGDQLWLRVIGPPGSGKTTLAECMSVAKEYIYSKSIFTGFHSGFTGGGPTVSKKDASLIPLINHKTFVIKEGDNLLTAPNRDRILSELRDLYDGTSRTAYRNRVSRNYESIQTTLVVCGTDSLRGLNRSSLGDRFIDCEIFGQQSSEPYLDRALKNTVEIVTGSLREAAEDNEASSNKMLYLKRATYGYIKYLKENLRSLPVPHLPVEYHERLKSLGQFLSFVRARGHRKDEDAGYRPRIELATRLVSQFTKLAICLALVQGKSEVDKSILDLISKVVIDTATSYNLEIVQLLSRYPNGASRMEIGFELKIPEETARVALLDMQRFAVATRKSESNKSGIRGRDLHIWQLTDQFKHLMDVAFGHKKATPPSSKGPSNARLSKPNPRPLASKRRPTVPPAKKAHAPTAASRGPKPKSKG